MQDVPQQERNSPQLRQPGQRIDRDRLDWSAKCFMNRSAKMTDLSDTAHLKTAPATLGDVLYAQPRAPVPECEWVALVRSIAAGDQLALHALYERAHRPVFTVIMRITANRETSEELTIDVFYDVWRRASGYDPANGTVLGWIMNQARSRAIDRLRFESRKKRRNDGNGQPLPEEVADPHDVLELREQAEALRTALATLTPDERRAIEITFFSGLTHIEAATHLNEPLGTIKTRIRSALHKLRRALTGGAS
jgi:RNA polymerase sigma-70 factor, ECF subfamily